jgi:hypothetical protein
MHALAPLALCLLLVPPGALARQDSAPAPSAAAATPLADPRLALVVADPAPDVALGMALWDARAGRTAAALERVAALRAAAQGYFAARQEREAARLEAWRALRDAYLAQLVSSGGKLVLPDGDKKARVGVERREGGVLHLAPNKPGWKTLAVEELPPGDLAQQMDRDADGLAPSWVRLYGYALAGTERWSKLLKDDAPEAAALRADANADFARLLNAGRCAEELARLSAAPAPADVAQADLLLARIDALRKEGAALDFVADRKLPLRALAASAHRVRFDAAGLSGALKGKVQDLGGGRIKVEYSFESPAEAEDFVPAGDYLRDHRGRLPPVQDGLRNAFWQEEGALHAEGLAGVRYVLPLAAPMSVEYDLSIEVPMEGDKAPPFLFVGICDDGAERFAWSSNFGDVEVWNHGQTVHSERQTSTFVRLGRGTVEKLVHDGARVSLMRDKQEVAALDCPHRRGDVFLWAHSGLGISVRRLTLEGTVDDEGRAALRERWVEKALASF